MRPRCGDEEEFIHGITSPDFDDGELSFDFFEGAAVSVSRLKIASLEESVEILKRVLIKTESNNVWRGFARFGHSALKQKTADYVQTNKALKKDKFEIWVEEDPQPDNKGHAEVMPQVTKGLARYLLDKIKFFEIEIGEYFKACRKDDASKAAIAVSYSRKRVLAEASEITSLPEDDLEVLQITLEEYQATRQLPPAS